MKRDVVELLVANPVLVLFIVCGLGYGVGRIPLGKGRAQLGSAGVLFVGLAVGALDRRLQLPSIVNTLGIVLFMYTVGLSSAAGFFGSLNRQGLRYAVVAGVPLVIGAALTLALAKIIGLNAGGGASVFTGSMSSSSGLAAIVDLLHRVGPPGSSTEPTVFYSMTYLDSIIGPMAVILIFIRLFKVDLKEESAALPEYRHEIEALDNATVKVTLPAAEELTVDELAKVDGHLMVLFGRIVRDGVTLVPAGDLRFKLGDLAVVVGPPDEITRVAASLGHRDNEEIGHEQTEFELRRVFVSEASVVGIPLRQLDVPGKLGAKITRVRRGESEFIPTGQTRLELGDRLRLLSQGDNMPSIRGFFGDSINALSEIDFLALGLGVSAGLLLGIIPVPLPGGSVLKLGLSGGPLIAGILLGRLNRTGSVVWTLPYSANLSLKQLGLLLFAAAIGTQSGYAFVDTLLHGQGAQVILAGLVLSLAVGALTMIIGYRFYKEPMNRLLGVYVGGQTQPIVLEFAKSQAGNDLAATGYAAVFPVATIIKIVLAQLVFGFLR